MKIKLKNTKTYGKPLKSRDSKHLVQRGNPRTSEMRPWNSLSPLKSSVSENEKTEKGEIRSNKGRKERTKAEKRGYKTKSRQGLYHYRFIAGGVLNYAQAEDGTKLKNRVCLCARHIQQDYTGDNPHPTATLRVSNETAKYLGLIVCDSNWLCPCCSAIYLSKQAEEIEKVQRNFLKAGEGKYWSTAMLTLTIPHNLTDKLGDLLAKKSAVMSDLNAHRQMKNLKSRIGCEGYVDSLEVRHSDANGWHPHHHILLFCKNLHPNTRIQSVYNEKKGYYRVATQTDKKRGYKLEKIPVEKFIYHLFAYLCVKHNLRKPSEKHGVDLTLSNDINDYLTKQSSVAKELTGEQEKEGKKGQKSRSQWEILKDCDSEDEALKNVSIDLFCDFATAIKGKAKIHWSPNFKENWLDEVEEKGMAEDDEDVVEYRISREIWNRFIESKDRSTQREILELAEEDYKNNTEKTKIFLDSLRWVIKNEKAEKEAEKRKDYEKWLDLHPPPRLA